MKALKTLFVAGTFAIGSMVISVPVTTTSVHAYSVANFCADLASILDFGDIDRWESIFYSCYRRLT